MLNGSNQGHLLLTNSLEVSDKTACLQPLSDNPARFH